MAILLPSPLTLGHHDVPCSSLLSSTSHDGLKLPKHCPRVRTWLFPLRCLCQVSCSRDAKSNPLKSGSLLSYHCLLRHHLARAWKDESLKFWSEEQGVLWLKVCFVEVGRWLSHLAVECMQEEEAARSSERGTTGPALKGLTCHCLTGAGLLFSKLCQLRQKKRETRSFGLAGVTALAPTVGVKDAVEYQRIKPGLEG